MGQQVYISSHKPLRTKSQWILSKHNNNVVIPGVGGVMVEIIFSTKRSSLYKNAFRQTRINNLYQLYYICTHILVHTKTHIEQGIIILFFPPSLCRRGRGVLLLIQWLLSRSDLYIPLYEFTAIVLYTRQNTFS